MAEYLLYWKYDTALQSQGIGALEYVASEQLGKIRVGDRVWTVTFHHGTPFLVGYVDVANVIKRKVADQHIESRPLWSASRYAIAAKRGRQHAALIDLRGIVARLEFDGRIRRLPSKLTFNSFRRIRRLTPKASKLLHDLWTGHAQNGRHGIKS